MPSPPPPVQVTSLADFINLTDDDMPWADLTLYRGQPVKGQLLPSVARLKPGKDTTREEKKVLSQLQLLGASMLEGTGSTDLDKLVVAQHFGLKTRLLDWTSNPLAALWFACSGRAKGDTYVYALEADQLLEGDVYSKDPFATAKTSIFQPRVNNARISAQDGWFSLHRYSATAKRFVPLEENKTTSKYLKEIRIPEQYKDGLLRSLERHGVSNKTLFPDLGGLCAYLNRRHWDA